MTRARSREIGNNHTNKRGIVTERDGKNRRVRVKFPDEDETNSFWIDVPGSGSSANASYQMPDVDGSRVAAIALTLATIIIKVKSREEVM